MEILFLDTPIIRAYGDGYVFDTQDGYDFHVYGYDDSYSNGFLHGVEFPNSGALVGLQSIDTFRGNIANFDITFNSPVSLLVFADHGKEDIAIDNLSVQAAPVPGAFALSGIGLGLVRLLRRRRMLS